MKSPIKGYVIEGHVPAIDVIKLLLERPETLGITMPGTPTGSQGMETDSHIESYGVVPCKRDGSHAVFASY